MATNKINMNITDCTVGIALTYFVYRGWSKGLMKTVLGPVSLALGLVMGWIYYQRTHNLITGFLLAAISPFVIRFFISILLALWAKASNEKAVLSTPSRLFGCAFSVLWSGSYLAVFLIALGMIPLKIGALAKIHADVTGSKSYTLISRWAAQQPFFDSPNLAGISDLMDDPQRMEQYKDTPEFNTLIKDKQLQAILSDETTAEQIQSKDYAQLMANPKVQEIFKDEELLKKILALNKIILNSDTDRASSEANHSLGQ